MRPANKLILLPVLGLLTACGHYSEDMAALEKQFENAPAQTYALNTDQDLNAVTPAAGAISAMPFNEALAREYYDLARTEQAEMDYQSAKLFTEKAKQAMAGENVLPVQAKTPQGLEKRLELMRALETQMQPENYMALARAQAQFDHWQEQKSEGHQTEDINQCQENFKQAMAALANPFTQTKSYAVMFGDVTDISAEAQKTLNEIAAYITENNIQNYLVALSGSEEQVKAVRAKLIEMKFPETRLITGQSQTAENTVALDLKTAPTIADQNI